MATSPHQSHDTVRLREYLAQVLQKNKDFTRMCKLIKHKYDDRNPHNTSKVRIAIKEKEHQLAKVVDKKISNTIASLKRLQS
jgi:acetoacetate decarboxylase